MGSIKLSRVVQRFIRLEARADDNSSSAGRPSCLIRDSQGMAITISKMEEGKLQGIGRVHAGAKGCAARGKTGTSRSTGDDGGLIYPRFNLFHSKSNCLIFE